MSSPVVVCTFELARPEEGLDAVAQLNEVFGPFTEEAAEDFVAEFTERSAATGGLPGNWRFLIQPLREDIVSWLTY